MKYIALLTCLLFFGCEPQNLKPAPPRPKPKIRVERQEDVNGVLFIVWYDDHYRDYLGNQRYSEPYARFRISDRDDLEEYKRQLEFLLSQIEEVEKRMKIHEPEGTTTGISKDSAPAP